MTDLWVEAWRATMPDIDFESRRGWIADFLWAPGHRTLVVEGGGPIGFVSLEGDHLHQLVVASAVQGDGTARRLLDAAKASAGAGLTLDVNQANARAVRFYEREGFAIEAPGINETSGLAAWRMRWTRGPHA